MVFEGDGFIGSILDGTGDTDGAGVVPEEATNLPDDHGGEHTKSKYPKRAEK